MWAVALNQEPSFLALRESLGGAKVYKDIVTGTGAKIAEAARDSQRPHLFLLGDSLAQTKNVLSYVQVHLHPSILVSSDLANDCHAPHGSTFLADGSTFLADGSTPATAQPTLFVPWICLRSAGRTDLGTAPVIYEELHFDSGVQRDLLGLLPLERTEGHGKLFGTTRADHGAPDCRWLSENLECRAWDKTSAEMLLAGKRLGVKVGCLKSLGHGPAALDLLLDGWLRVVELL